MVVPSEERRFYTVYRHGAPGQTAERLGTQNSSAHINGGAVST